MHILGTANSVGEAWYAVGNYVNDDGLTTNLVGNYNHYSFAAMADLNDPTTITVDFSRIKTASNYV